MNKNKQALLHSVVAMLLCISMLIGATFAWFTDSVVSTANVISTGTLKIGLYHTNAAVTSETEVTNETKDLFEVELWEPGVATWENFTVKNEGSLWLKYQLGLNALDVNYVEKNGTRYYLAEVLKAGVVPGGVLDSNADGTITREEAIGQVTDWVALNDVMEKGDLAPEGEPDSTIAYGVVIRWEPGANDNNLNVNNGSTTSDGNPLTVDLGVTLAATQQSREEDSFGPDYDTPAEFPELELPVKVTVTVPNDGSVTTEAVTMVGRAVTATVPAGVKLQSGKEALTLTVTEKESSQANITTGATEDLVSLDVHIDGVDAANDKAIIVDLGPVMPKYLNIGNYRLYHVENGATTQMTAVATLAEVDTHNEFYYDLNTGSLTVAMATFSEVALVADTVNPWGGKFDYTWYDADADELKIANADQLAAFGAIVGGMNGQTKDSFSGQTVKLIADINLGDAESENKADLIFYPIGYYNSNKDYKKVSGGSVTSSVSSFEGTFDGQGHTVANFYQNTWEMFGDYNDGYSGTPNHYKDAMGLFGYVYGGTVKNLTVDHFSSDGEFTPTGVIAAYADGKSTFENIALTNCNPRVYNTGNGGIIGIAGDTSAANDDHITLKNITVDNSNKISALWGSWDVACGGLVGMYRGNVDANGNATGDTISFENCHVSAIIDVYNDVCANYQYYAYRYAGMIIGSVRHNTKNAEGKTIPNMTGISATGCTVNYGDWNDYYYCEFEKNTMASYSEDYQFSRVPHSELDFTDANGNGVVDASERASVTGCKHTHTAEENHQAIYLPFHQLFTGYSWGVSSLGLETYGGITVEGRTDIDVDVGDQEASVVKFETKFKGDFLYRVGNQNTVALGSLFAAKDGATISSSGVVASIVKVDENMNVSGIFEANASDWTKGTIKFEGTGVVKVTIQDYNFCTPTELTLEVVDATNITEATGTTTGGNFVLLCDVNTTSYKNYWDSTVYGNGFTYSLKGAPTDYNSKQGHGILITKNATLDNLVIVGDVYNSYGAYTNQECYNAAVEASNTIIKNCYISNCATPVRANGVTLKNTTLYGGTIANMLISGGSNVLQDVTTVNYNDENRDVLGLGIVVAEGATENTRIILNGDLKQHNYVYQTDVSDVPGDEAKAVFNSMFEDSFKAYHIAGNPKSVNTGIIFMTETLNTDIITDNAGTGYVRTDNAEITLTVSGFSTTVNGAVYAPAGSGASVDNDYNAPSQEQGDYLPTFSFDLGEQMLAKDNDDDTRYLIGDANGVEAMYPQGEDALTLDLTKLATVSKYDVNYAVTAKCVCPNGEEKTGTVTLTEIGTYKLVFTVNDNIFYDANGNQIDKTVERTYEVPLVLDVYQKSVADATLEVSSADLDGEYISSGSDKKYKMYPLQAISSIMDDANKDGTPETFNFKSNIQSAVLTPESNNAFSSPTTITITYTGGQVLTIVLGTPTGLSSPGASNGGKTFSVYTEATNGIYIQSDGKIASGSAATGTWPLTSWSFKGTSGKVVTDSTQVTINFTKPSSSGTTCLAEGTLVTLEDGSKRAVEDLRKGDRVMAFDHLSGSITANDVIIVVRTYADSFYRNTFVFDDGTKLTTINEHGIYDLNLDKYVNIDHLNGAEFIGHSFVSVDTAGKLGIKKLVNVISEQDSGYKYDIVTDQTLNYVAEDTLSVTHVLVDVINSFDFAEDMTYDKAKMAADIETYGLYGYDEWAAYCDTSVFEQYNIPVMKVGISKGLYTKEYIIGLINTYVLDESVQIVD